MYIESAQITIYIPHSASLKDKRQISRSIIDKLRQKFNVSASEVDTQDMHQTLTVGVAVVSGESKHAAQSLNAIIRFIEEYADGEVVKVDRL